MSASGWSSAISLVVAIVILGASFRQWWSIGMDGDMRTRPWVKRMFALLIVALVVSLGLLVASET